MRQNYLTFGRPDIGEEEIAEVVATLRSGWIGTGPKVGAFEDAFKDYVGVEHAIAVSSCSAALHLSVLASGIGPGDEVITSPMTFCATVNAIVHVGATPVFADIDRETMNIDPERIEASMTPQTKAIIPVHFAGRPCDMEAIRQIAGRRGLIVIEDAAHAIEARAAAGKIGALGDLACFSFYATKNVVTAEGGMVTTNRSDWVDQLNTGAMHGMSRDAWRRYSDAGYKHYQVELPGFKYNMTDIQASLGLHQLRNVDVNGQRREAIWLRYDEAFGDGPLQIPAAPQPGETHARHLYTVLVDEDLVGIDRDEFQGQLHHLNIGTGIHYVAVHLHPYYARTWGFRRGDYPAAEYISDRTLSLPLGPGMDEGDVADVIAAVTELVQRSRPSAVPGTDWGGITVVSGLPRSGTSMLMKMLAGGGIEPITDGERRADDDNPGGYYEFEKVKQLERDASWLRQAGGKSLKVISQLLDKLPTDRRYKVVFALRDMQEILASQRAMLKRRGRAEDVVNDGEIAAVFERHLAEVRDWIEDQDHMEVLYVDYAAVLADPLHQSRRIAEFLGGELDARQMAGVVDERLYRQRG